MNTKTRREGTFLSPLGHRKCGIAWSALLFLLPLAAPGDGVVTNCTEANLRAALAGGGTVTFACDGTILLSCLRPPRFRGSHRPAPASRLLPGARPFAHTRDTETDPL